MEGEEEFEVRGREEEERECTHLGHPNAELCGLKDVACRECNCSVVLPVLSSLSLWGTCFEGHYPVRQAGMGGEKEF